MSKPTCKDCGAFRGTYESCYHEDERILNPTDCYCEIKCCMIDPGHPVEECVGYELLEALKAAEWGSWIDGLTDNACPVCLGYKPEGPGYNPGHKSGCILNAAIKKAEGS